MATVDIRVLREALGDDPVRIADVLATYRTSLTAAAQDLHRAVADRDGMAVQAAAHRLKSPSFAVGANGLGNICVAMETAALALDWPRVEALAGALRGTTPEVLACIRLLLDGSPDSENA